MGQTQRKMGSGQIRFMAPERGVNQLAVNAILNALWDLWAKVERKPLWQLVADMSPKELVRCIDFRYITDVLTPEQALEMLKQQQTTKHERMQLAKDSKAVPAYNTSVGWLGHSDDTVRKLLREATDQGFKHFKLKVGLGQDVDRKRLGLVREAVGDEGVLMTDVNQLWDVDIAIEYMSELLRSNPHLKPWFIEEPTAPDDVLGHAKIRKALKQHGCGVATGEHMNTRVLFKQLLQAEAVDVIQPDACRLAGVNELLSVMLLAAKFDVPILPHAGGAGMVELCSHLSTIDFVVVSGKKSVLEYTDHLHEAFEAPAKITSDGYHETPTTPGYSCDVKEAEFEKYEFPDGSFWKTDQGLKMANDPWRGCYGEQTS
ncbi:uncharacterized protein LTR77_006163 [Saxophila tyrrhenica]|uniref:Mandelate racemase/muconate lactonizing enzyme C-terminal domain-containing protein n=1 Tax=Saxophila tyrrhenica TaxID=1690608 RepID=A0AAV9P721_9PEZI|nr:hypothetical protein LTR77_006163 [Saxophila tyrrhenica]